MIDNELPEPDPEISVIKENRAGIFWISDALVQSDPSLMRAVFNDVIARKPHWWNNATQYLGYSRHFEPVEEGVIPPTYVAEFTKHEDGSVTWEWKKA